MGVLGGGGLRLVSQGILDEVGRTTVVKSMRGVCMTEPVRRYILGKARGRGGFGKVRRLVWYARRLLLEIEAGDLGTGEARHFGW